MGPQQGGLHSLELWIGRRQTSIPSVSRYGEKSANRFDKGFLPKYLIHGSTNNPARHELGSLHLLYIHSSTDEPGMYVHN